MKFFELSFGCWNLHFHWNVRSKFRACQCLLLWHVHLCNNWCVSSSSFARFGFFTMLAMLCTNVLYIVNIRLCPFVFTILLCNVQGCHPLPLNMCHLLIGFQSVNHYHKLLESSHPTFHPCQPHTHPNYR